LSQLRGGENYFCHSYGEEELSSDLFTDMESKKIILNNQQSQNASMEILLGERIIFVTVMGRKNCRQIFSQIWEVKNNIK